MAPGTRALAEVLAADDARYAAMVAGDTSSLDNLLGDELIYSHSTGHLDSKKTFLESLVLGNVRYLTADRSEEQFRLIDDVALLTGYLDLRVEVSGELLELRNRFTTTWLRRHKGWQLLSWASTPTQRPR